MRLTKYFRLILIILIVGIAISFEEVEEASAETGSAYCSGGNLVIQFTLVNAGYVGNEYRINGTGPNLPTPGQIVALDTYTYIIAGPGTWSDLHFEYDNLNVSDFTDSSGVFVSPTSITCEGLPPLLPNPQIGMISISTSQAQPVYESAGGDVVRDGSGNELRLPQDYDGNGFDTHLVMSSTEIDGQLWYEIWIGGQGTTVWLPADNVTVVE